MNEAITVSNSEVSSFQSCQRRHYYHHILGLEPKVHSIPLDRGNTGHKALEIFYQSKINGADKQEATGEAHKYIYSYLAQQAVDMMHTNDPTWVSRMKMYRELSPLIQGFADYYWNENIEPIEVEAVHKVKLNDKLKLGLKVDLLGVYTSGQFKGDYVVIDWKFRYNFFRRELLDLIPQIPKYVWALSQKDITVTKGVYDTLRYRSLTDSKPENIYDRPMIRTKPSVRDKIIEDHIIIAETIYDRRKLPVAESNKLAIRTLSEFTCKHCPFTSICSLELRGEDPTLKISTDFKPSDYGYDLEIADEVLGF